MLLFRVALTAVLFLSSIAFAADQPGAPEGMVLVPAGAFIMGTGSGREEEAPPRRVDLPAFHIDRQEVTNADYARYMKATGAKPPINWAGPEYPKNQGDFPVTEVTWFDAMRYAVWAGKRLPTEAEWEKAARGPDGRRFPWGDVDEPDRRVLGASEGLRPVGSFPAGASPYGCLDMSGNAWEWTADWFRPYTGTAARSVHFGRQYKSMRGGGGIHFYGVDNRGDCTQRGRMVPYGSHDALGFRCVRDLAGNPAPYDPAALLAEAEAGLQASLKKPVELAYEKEFAGYLRHERVPLRITGAPGQTGIVRVGVPLPVGVGRDLARLAVVDGHGTPRPTQVSVLSKWKDGAPRWVCLDFAGAAGEKCALALRNTESLPARPEVRVSSGDGRVSLDTGVSALLVEKGSLAQLRHSGEALWSAPMDIRLVLVTSQGPAEVIALPAEQVDVEERGPVRAILRLRGAFGAANGEPSVFRYDMRVHAVAGSARMNMLLTVTHFAPSAERRDDREPEPSIPVADIIVQVSPSAPLTHAAFGGDRTVHAGPLSGPTELLQPDDLNYTCRQGGEQIAHGTRARGWVTARAGDRWLTLGVRHFWQNHAKALVAAPDALGVRLWAGDKPFPWESGLAKTHEIILDVSEARPEQVELDPLRAVVAPAWACGAEGVGPMLPRGPEAIVRFPYWELMRETAKRRWVQGMPTGMRDFGDAYMGGPYKGKNAYSNLEYDVPFNFLMDHLKTGETWYLEAAEVQARHQADIDVDHHIGRAWKHSPHHTTTEAELGHVFVRGLLLHYLTTGERRSLDVARAIGDWIAPKVERLEGIGNERQIGWSQYALAGLYEATQDERYLNAALIACRKLAEGQAPSGKFNIRWDNRISFFNGIAMNGMLTTQQQSGDDRIADTILAVARRTFGFYPEYALRTINAFCWAAERTGDPRFLDALERTWLTSMDWLFGREAGVTEEVYAWQFTHFAARHRMFDLFEGDPPALPDPASWQGTRLEGPRIDLYLRTTGERPARVMVIREGLASGIVELLDGKGGRVDSLGFHDERRLFEAKTLTLPKGAAIHHLRLTSADAKAWQLHYDAATSITLHDPGSAQLPNLYPRAFGSVVPGAKEVVVRLEATGEGFHTATLYDEAGNPLATVRHFIDFQDPGRYELELKATVPEGAARCALEVYNLKVLTTQGLLPYWSRSPDDWFNPERDTGLTR